MPYETQKKWLLTRAAESAAIVASILLAFAIDAWWADRQIIVDEERVLVALKSDFEATLVSISEIRKYREGVIESASRLLAASAGNTSLESEELDRLIGDVLWTGSVDFSTGALDSLLQGGTLANIQNAELRHHLTTFTHLIPWIRTKDARKHTRLRMYWFPFLYKNASFAQIQQANDEVPGLGLKIDLLEIPIREYRDHSPLLGDDEFHGMLTTEYVAQIDMLRTYEVLEDNLQLAIQLINAELSQR